MKDYWVCSKSQVADKTSKYGATHVVSTLDPGERPYLHPQRKVEHLLVHFEDTEKPNDIYAPEPKHLKQILDWTARVPDDAVLLIHCYAGMCRSTAVALLVDLQHNYKAGDDWKPFFERLLKKRDIAIPNTLVLKYGLAHLDLDPDVQYEILKDVESYNQAMILKRQW